MLRRRFSFIRVAAFVLAAHPVAWAQTPPPAGRVAVVAPAEADVSDPFFDDTVLHDIKLTINGKDWESLKVHYLENTVYPCYFQWNDQLVRNVGIRSRGTGSRSGVKPGL